MAVNNKVLLLLLCLANHAFSANILYLGAIPSPSHYIWNRALAFGLLAKGHHVTMVSPDKDKGPVPQNYSRIILEEIYETMKLSEETETYCDIVDLDEFGAMQMFYQWAEGECKRQLESKGTQELITLLKSGKQFDLIVVDVTIGPCYYPVFKLANYPPTVGVTPFMLPTYVSFIYGGTLQPSYIPWYALPYSTEMTILQRAKNLFFTYLDIYWWMDIYGNHDKYYHHFDKNPKSIPPIKELQKHISLILANTDPALDHAQPIPPNIIPVGGLHTRAGKKLPDDIQALADKSTNGIIVFSLGSNIRSDQLKPEAKEAFLTAFGKMKETVIWKFESELENIPKNVLIKKWLPQNDILWHKNVKLFMGHGGALSTQEAAYHGVPIIAVPFFVDQFINAQIILKKEIGLSIDIRTITSDVVYNTLRSVLDDPKYKKNAVQLSTLFRDRLETPLERGVFWIEYMLRHKSADFLTPQLRNMSFVAGSNLDIFAIAAVILTVVLLVSVKLLTAVYSWLITKPSKKVKKN